MTRMINTAAILAAASVARAATQEASPVPRLDAFGAASVALVSDSGRYDSWPMVQTLPGGRIVCAFSRGAGHSTGEKTRGVFSRVSDDGGATWGGEVLVCDSQEWGEVTVGKGLDSTGAMLLWIRRQDRRGWGEGTFHELWRSRDGLDWEKIAEPDLSPHPIQITDVFALPSGHLASLWFSGTYARDASDKSWGIVESGDDGLTWTQRTIESGLSAEDWPTEPSAAPIGDGCILAIARSEGAKWQFQLESRDGGESWTRRRTNISDVRQSTPSLVFDPATGIVANYYYQRGAKHLKRRSAPAAAIFGAPESWPKPEILAAGAETRPYDAGNANAAALPDGSHAIVTYTGSPRRAAVFAVKVPPARQ